MSFPTASPNGYRGRYVEASVVAGMELWLGLGLGAGVGVEGGLEVEVEVGVGDEGPGTGGGGGGNVGDGARTGEVGPGVSGLPGDRSGVFLRAFRTVTSSRDLKVSGMKPLASATNTIHSGPATTEEELDGRSLKHRVIVPPG